MTSPKTRAKTSPKTMGETLGDRSVRGATVDADVFVIGAGPAGLTTAYCLTKAARSVVVIERDPIYVGGISRTVDYNGFLFDIGGHRFFSSRRRSWLCGGKSCPTTSSPGRGCRGFITTANSSPIRSRPSRRYSSWAYSRARRALCPTSMPGFFRSPRRGRSTTGCATSSANGCFGSSSRPTPRRCGACRVTRFPPTGRRSASRASIWRPPCSTA